jgi:S1-C subfamily serine protease
VLALRLEAQTAVYVREVLAGSPAARAGIARGDLLLAVGGKPVQAVDDIHRILSAARRGNEIEVRVLRGTRIEEFTLTGEELPD